MTDVIVSIRFPQSILSELKTTAKKQHYMDLSELIRSVARKKWENATQPYSLSGISNDIVEDVKDIARQKSESLLADELKRIKERLKNELQ